MFEGGCKTLLQPLLALIRWQEQLPKARAARRQALHTTMLLNAEANGLVTLRRHPVTRRYKQEEPS